MRLVQLSRHSIAFPSPEGALREPNGLLALGGDLSPARLLMAYQRGIFPWFSPGDPILWWSPDPRAVLWPESLHISRSMKRFHKRSPYRVTMNYAFGQVIEGCASDREEGTWITRGVVEACLLYTSPSPRDISGSRLPSSAWNGGGGGGGGGSTEILRCLVGSE
ncbi:leucyl/phenylalanyl-tRNA--protein transferase, partial [Escherichia coli]